MHRSGGLIVDHVSTVGRIAEASGGTITCGDPEARIETVTTDSRELGTNNLFIPLVGEKFDGHDFIRRLSDESRISSYLTMRDGYTDAAARNRVSEIRCDDTLRALGLIAGSHRDQVDPQVIGITGTNGKTTTKELIYSVLSDRRKCLKNQKNYNNEIGVPVTLLGLKSWHEIAIIEMGMNHKGEIDRLSRIAKPDIALITNIGEGHLEFLGSVENVGRAKSEITHGMEKGAKLVLNRDMHCFDFVMKEARRRGLQVKTFGLSAEASIRPDSYELYLDKIVVVYKGIEIAASLYGIHNVYNIVAALAIADEYGVTPAEARASLADFKAIEGRSQIIDRGYIVINDSYNSNPLSLEYALRSAREIFPKRRKIAALSDMKELGSSAEEYHVRCGKAVAENGFDMLLAWGDFSKSYATGACSAGLDASAVRLFDTKSELARYLAGILTGDDVVLIKGSRSMKMEDVVESVAAKGV